MFRSIFSRTYFRSGATTVVGPDCPDYHLAFSDRVVVVQLRRSTSSLDASSLCEDCRSSIDTNRSTSAFETLPCVVVLVPCTLLRFTLSREVIYIACHCTGSPAHHCCRRGRSTFESVVRVVFLWRCFPWFISWSVIPIGTFQDTTSFGAIAEMLVEFLWFVDLVLVSVALFLLWLCFHFFNALRYDQVLLSDL